MANVGNAPVQGREAGVRRQISRGELGSSAVGEADIRGLSSCEDLSGILFLHLEPFSNSLGDACSALRP